MLTGALLQEVCAGSFRSAGRAGGYDCANLPESDRNLTFEIAKCNRISPRCCYMKTDIYDVANNTTNNYYY